MMGEEYDEHYGYGVVNAVASLGYHYSKIGAWMVSGLTVSQNRNVTIGWGKAKRLRRFVDLQWRNAYSKWFGGVKVVRNTRQPENVDDGDVVYCGMGTSVEDVPPYYGLWHYGVYTYDGFGNVGRAVYCSSMGGLSDI